MNPAEGTGRGSANRARGGRLRRIAVRWRVAAGLVAAAALTGPWAAGPGWHGAARAQQAQPQDAVRPAAEVQASAGWTAPWDRSESVGDAGDPVEVIYEDGWVLVGERVAGIPIYRVPSFEVPARKLEDVPMYPCMDCHAKHPTDYRSRTLKVEHTNVVLRHGGRDFWCTECHNGKNMNQLLSTAQKPIDMDLGYLLCGQCHSPQLKDWHHGAHGKRIGMWQGPRVLRTCPECHNAHAPAIQPFAPVALPVLRAGLLRPERHPAERRHGTARWLRAGAGAMDAPAAQPGAQR